MTGTWMWRWRYWGSVWRSWTEVGRKDGKTERRKVRLLSVMLLSVLLLSVLPSFRLSGQRAPVLKQIHVPHAYYWRELYLPQATSGPSPAAWSPDREELRYSLQRPL